MDRADVAVIGSGFGGLTAGALLARGGLQVAVFEQHTRPGGCAGDFAMDGFWFPAGATVVTGLEPGGILAQVFAALGLAPPGVELDPSIILHSEEHALPYARQLERWLDLIAGARPGFAKRYRPFWEWTHETGGAVYEIGRSLPSFPLERWRDVRRTLPALRPGALRAVRPLFETIAAVKRRLGATGDPIQDAWIDALLLDATGATAAHCSAVQGAIALDLYRRGCQWVEGGTARLAMDLVRRIRADGGEVRFRACVVSLARVPGGWEVRTAEGRALRARRVVANVPPAALARLLGRTGRDPADHEAWGAFVLHLGIDGTALPPLHPFHQVVAPHGPLHDGGNAFVSIFPGRGVRARRWSVSVSTHTRARSWRLPDPCRQRDLEERLIDAAARVIPGVRERVLLRRSATPATFERYTLRPLGFAGGLIQRPGNTVFRAASRRPAPGIVLAGDHVFPGQGTVGVALSGVNAARDIAQSLGRKPLL